MQTGNNRRRSRRSRKSRLSLRQARRGGARQVHLARVLSFAGAALALLAAVLLISYLVQGHNTRQEQARQRELYRANQAAQAVLPTEDAQTPSSQAQTTAPVLTENQDEGQTVADREQEAPQETAASAADRQVVDDRFLPLMRRNNDTVGWLSYSMFPEMDFAVVQRDNDYYMYRAFTGEKNVAGTVFLDQSNSIRPRDRNLILHGHNMKNGTMFGKLQKLMDPAFLRTQPVFTFDTLYQDASYVPYALTVFSVNPSSPQYFNIIKPNFEDAGAMGDSVNWLRYHSVLTFPTQLHTEDRLLTLVTCHGSDDDERLVLALRAVRPGEDAQALMQEYANRIERP